MLAKDLNSVWYIRNYLKLAGNKLKWCSVGFLLTVMTWALALSMCVWNKMEGWVKGIVCFYWKNLQKIKNKAFQVFLVFFFFFFTSLDITIITGL